MIPSVSHHHYSVAKSEQHYMVKDIWPLRCHKVQVALMCRKVRYLVMILGAKCIIHVVYVDHKVPTSYMAPWDENRRPEKMSRM